MELSRVADRRDGGHAPDSAALGVDAEAMRRAEAAVAAMREDYLAWLRRDVARLDAMLAQAQRAGDAADFAGMLRIAHDMRGQGGTFGFPLVSEVAASLGRLLRLSGARAGGPEVAADLALAGRHLAMVRSLADGRSDEAVRAAVTGLERAVAGRAA